MRKAALYARVSTDGQQKEGTIQSQLVELRKQVAAAGHELVKEYIDDGYSGTLLDRPGLDQLRADAKSDVYDAIHFLDADRITRDVSYQRIIIAELLKHGKQIIIKGKDYVDLPENKFTVTVLGAVAEFERAKIIERTTRGRLPEASGALDVDSVTEVTGVVLADAMSPDDVAVRSVDVERSLGDDEASTSAKTGRKTKIARAARSTPMIANGSFTAM
jgi:Resolvase, N terminal domain